MADKREKYLLKILHSESPANIIVAGPGTGKTFTFGKLFEHKSPGNFLALTFIRKLAANLKEELSPDVHADTFHAYCKGILHKLQGKVDIIPSLTKIITSDARILNPLLSDFDKKFQLLEEGSTEISFYLMRGDYYQYLSFNDSVCVFLRFRTLIPDLTGHLVLLKADTCPA